LAHNELASLEHAGDPSDEERELERTYLAIRGECVGLLGYDPGEHLLDVLRSKPDVADAVTSPLVTALMEAGVGAFSRSIDVEARAWLSAFEAEERACKEVETQLGLINAQLAALDQGGPSAAERAAVTLAVETIVGLAGDRAQNADRIAELLGRELAARQAAALERAMDTSVARDLAGSVTALRWLIRDEEHRSQRELDGARERLRHATEAVRTATERLDAARRTLGMLLGRVPEPGSLAAEALQELERSLREAASAHEDAMGATVRRAEAVDALAGAREKLSLHLAWAPPPLPEQPAPMDLVAMSRWVANRDDHPAIMLVATRSESDELSPEVVDALLELSREYWVVTTVDVVHGALRLEEQPPGATAADGAQVWAPVVPTTRLQGRRSLRASRRAARGRLARRA